MPECAMPAPAVTAAPVRRRRMPRRHRLMLLAAFEVLVFGFAQANDHPQRRGILIEMSVRPGHVVT